jgi:hypothetical protein
MVKQIEEITIMEIKPNLTSSLQNVNLVLATNGGAIIGEVQLIVGTNELPASDFKDHILYELRRLHKIPF